MSKPTYSWDSTIFIAWLGDESTAPLGNIAAVAQEIDENKANFVVSVEAYAEVLEAKHTPEQMAAFNKFLKRSNVTLVDKTQIVAQKVGEIRSRALATGRKLTTPDATFIATAILYGADSLHSLDRDLLSLNGDPIVDGLKIIEPITASGQGSVYP